MDGALGERQRAEIARLARAGTRLPGVARGGRSGLPGDALIELARRRGRVCWMGGRLVLGAVHLPQWWTAGVRLAMWRAVQRQNRTTAFK